MKEGQGHKGNRKKKFYVSVYTFRNNAPTLAVYLEAAAQQQKPRSNNYGTETNY